MDVVEKTRSVCGIYILLAWDMDTSISADCQLTINSTTMQCQWNETRPPLNTGRKSREDYLHSVWAWFLHSTHTQGRADNPMQNSTLPLHSYPPCAIQIHLVWRENVLLLLILINQLSSVSPDLVSDLKGAWQVHDHQGQLRDRHSYVALTIHLGSKQPLRTNSHS